MTYQENELLFKLCVKLAKSLAIKLSNEKDRAIASKWITLIENTTDENANSIKNHVIQLLLLCLLRNCLVEPFEIAPDTEKILTQYEWCIQPHSIVRSILENEYNKNGEPDIYIEISGDLCEYIALQEIPKFGYHFYYAYSPENIKKWNNLDKDVIPKGLLNMTVISSPDNSVLADTIRIIKKKKKDALDDGDEGNDILNCNKNTFDKVTILQRDGSVQKQFLVEQPGVNVFKEKEIQQLVKRGILEPNELEVDNAIMEDSPEVRGTYIANVAISKNKQIYVNKKKMRHEQLEDFEYDKESNRIDEARKEMLAKIPSRLRERLARKYLKQVVKADEENICAPDIFEDKLHKKQQKAIVTGVKGVKIKSQPLPDDQEKKWKIEEFRLSPSEKFRPAHHVIDDLIKEQKNQHLSSELTNSLYGVKESFERSWQKYQNKKQKVFGPEPLSKRRAMLFKKLQRLKSHHTKKIVFDDMDIAIEPEEIQFEKFVYSEFPDDPADVTILDDMPTDDIFGPDQIADIKALSEPKAIYELEKTSILLDAEMKIDDIFGEDKIEDPKLAYKEVVIEGKRDYGCTSGSYRVGKRIVAIPGEEPISQSYIEQTGNEALYEDTLQENYTPTLTDSMINNYADEKLTKLLGGTKQTPRLYGPWATEFQEYIDRMERGENDLSEVEENDARNRSILNNSQMETDDIFGHTTAPSLVFRKEKATKQTQKLEAIKKHMAERKIKKNMWDSNQDLLEPYIYETFYEPYGILDASTQEEQQQTPLIKTVHVQSRRDPFLSFERQLDESLQYFEDESLPCLRPRVFLDTDFLNRKIQDEKIPADNSILDSDEMCDYLQQSEIEGPQKMITISSKKTVPDVLYQKPQQVFSHLYISKKNTTPPEIPGILTEAYMEQEISGFENFLVEPEDNLSSQILEPSQIHNADIVHQNSIISPLKTQYQSPAHIALIKSIEQTKRFETLAKKFRSQKGISHQTIHNEFPKLQTYIEYGAQMFDKICPQQYFPQTNYTLLDKSSNTTDLPAPLIKSLVAPSAIDPFASFEEKMEKDLNLNERSFGHSFINEGELSGMFDEKFIAEPTAFHDLELSEYPQVNKFLLSGICEEKIDDTSCPLNRSSDIQNETIWPEDINNKYEGLLKLTQKQNFPDSSGIYDSKFMQKNTNQQVLFSSKYQSSTSETATEETLKKIEKINDFVEEQQYLCSDEFCKKPMDNANEQTKKINKLRRKVRAFKDLQNKPKLNYPIELLPDDRISAVTDPSLLYETPNISACSESFKQPTTYKTPVSQCTKQIFNKASFSKIPTQYMSTPDYKRQRSERRKAYSHKELITDNFLENETMPNYKSPIFAKTPNISFYAKQIDLRQIQEEEMPSFDSSIPLGQSSVYENFDKLDYTFDDKFDPKTSLSDMQVYEIKTTENSKTSYDTVSPRSSAPFSVESKACRLNDIKQRFTVWKNLPKNRLNNNLIKNSYPFLIKNESKQLSPNIFASEHSHLKKMFTDKSASKKSNIGYQFSPTIEFQENLEEEQMPMFETPPKAKPIQMPIISRLSGNLLQEDMPLYNSPPKLQSIRTISGEFKDKEEYLKNYEESSLMQYTIASETDKFSVPFKSLFPITQDTSLHQPSEVYASEARKYPRSPLVRQPIKFLPVTWGSFDKTPQFNISFNNADSIANISPPQYLSPPQNKKIPLNLLCSTRIPPSLQHTKPSSVYKVVQLPRKTGLSPLQFGLQKTEKEDSFLENEKFPSTDFPSKEYPSGEATFANYTPKSGEQCETARKNKKQIPSRVNKKPIYLQDYEYIRGEEAFKWLGNMVHYEDQIQRTPTKSKTKPSTSKCQSRADKQQSSHCSSKPSQTPNKTEIQKHAQLQIRTLKEPKRKAQQNEKSRKTNKK